MGKNIIPEIRFRGFNNSWRIDALSSVADIYDGVHQTPKYVNSGIMFLSVENIKTLSSKKFITQEAFERDFQVYPQSGDILMTRIGDIGTANVVTTNNPLAYYVSLALLKPKGFDSFFLKECIHSSFVQSELAKRTLQVAFPMKINKNEIGKVLCAFPPNFDEQKNIGRFFYDIDETISAKREELEKLENLKKASMERMFPREGETTPRLRFNGFTKKWERCQLNTVCSYHTSALTIADAIEGGLYPLYDANGQIGFYNQCIQEEYISIIKDGSGVGRTRIMPKLSYIIGTMGAIKAHKEIDVYYLYCLISNINFSEFINGATIPHVYFRDYGDAYVAIPSFDEQQKIGAYFRHLDDLIAAKRQEIEKLQNIKQSLLDKMFV